MTAHLRAFVEMGFSRYGRSRKFRTERHTWVRGMLSSDSKLREALLYLGTNHILCGGSKEQWANKKRAA